MKADDLCDRATRGLRRPSLGLMARLGKSIAKQSEGRAGKKVCQWVGGDRPLIGPSQLRAYNGAGVLTEFLLN